MSKKLNVYDLNRKKIAVVENAFNIPEEQELNNIYNLSFTIPSNDPKREYCQPFHFVRFGDDGEMYRIIGQDAKENDTGTITYKCEHVIATLCDTVMFGSFTYGSTDIHTREVIEWLLAKQTVQNWVLGDCDFDFQFEYGWEQENLLNALYAVPKEFSTPYIWTFDTVHYPWTVNLKAIDVTATPSYYIRANRNLISSNTQQDNADVCTRIYPLGYGEGVNQLTIREVNNDVPYLEASAEAIARYGIKEKVLVDRSFENAETLKAYAQTVLDNLSEPAMTRSFDVTDLYEITNSDIDQAEVGKICKLTNDGTITYVTKTTRVLDDAGNLKIELSTKSTDVATTIADLADRVRIESVYAQGATQLYQHSKDANATPSKGMVMSLYFPTEMKQINKVLLRMQLKRFRSYSSTTDAGGGSSQTSASGGGGSVTSASGGGSGTTSTSSNSVSMSGDSDAVWTYNSFQPTTSTAYAYGNTTSNDTTGYTNTAGPSTTDFNSHTHSIRSSVPHEHDVTIKVPTLKIPINQFQHSHSVSLSGGSHSHTFSIGSHSHSVSIPSHTHTVSIPSHTHRITAGIFESGSASGFDVYVRGQKWNTELIAETHYNDDITEWLIDANTGSIPRGSWIDIEIRPNDLAYVVASVFVQGFIQSRGGGNY